MKLPGLFRPIAVTIGFLTLTNISALSAETGSPVRLYVREVPIKVLGKAGKVIAIEQESGVMGLELKTADGFSVEVVNQLKEPTCFHWHGLVLPALLDGVPFVTQDPIPPGGSFRYQFPLKQSGTYWMHSHYGLQEQLLAEAPLILENAEQETRADEQYVILLADYSFKPPRRILTQLKGGMRKMAGMGMKKMDGMAKATGTQKLVAQKWLDESHGFGSAVIDTEFPDTDVKYDALLANRRTFDDPDIFRVKAGHTVLLRIIGGSAATNFFVKTGALPSQLLAVDGQDIVPVPGNFFQLGIAQRIDLLVKIPAEGGVFPIIAQGEGTKQQCGVLLATEGKVVPKMALQADLPTAGLDNTQELRLSAKVPLPEKAVDRSLSCVLGGSMAKYVWTINGAVYPNRNSLVVKEGERVEIVFRNETGMAHPMHLHGHDFEVTEIDGKSINGALRDTLLVPPNSTSKAIFDADNPGVWAFHCHILYHAAVGMFTVLKYDGAETRFWQPEKTLTEIDAGTAKP